MTETGFVLFLKNIPDIDQVPLHKPRVLAEYLSWILPIFSLKEGEALSYPLDLACYRSN